MRIVFDLDGTLADGTHREHFIIATEDREKPDWDAFFAASGDDKPIPHVIQILRALWKDGADIEIWSGRGEGPGDSVFKITEDWLAEHDVPWERLRMRPHGDYTPDVELKRAWLNEARDAGVPPVLVFDDRDKVVAMWRAEGIPCFQVAPGDF